MAGEIPSRIDPDMSDEDYFALDAIDQTQLKAWMRSPMAWAAALKNEEPTPAMRFGTAMHSLVLGKGAMVALKPDSRTKEGKAKAKSLEDLRATLLPKADWERTEAMLANPKDILKTVRSHRGTPETAMIAEDPATGLLLKGKADWLAVEERLIIDYKTCSDAAAFADDIFSPVRRYDIQAAFYMRLARLCGDRGGELTFRFIAQEKTAPYDFAQYDLKEHDPAVEAAQDEIDYALTGMKGFQERHGDRWREDASGMGLSLNPVHAEPTAWQWKRLHGDLPYGSESD